MKNLKILLVDEDTLTEELIRDLLEGLEKGKFDMTNFHHAAEYHAALETLDSLEDNVVVVAGPRINRDQGYKGDYCTYEIFRKALEKGQKGVLLSSHGLDAVPSDAGFDRVASENLERLVVEGHIHLVEKSVKLFSSPENFYNLITNHYKGEVPNSKVAE